MTTDRPRTAPRAGWALLVGAISLLLAVALCVSVVLRPRSPASVPTTDAHDPRRDYAGPFRNVDPAVQYVPNERCADCHADKARSFAEHPMGRSLLPLAQAAAPPVSPRYHNPFEALGSHFLVDREQERTWHRRIQLDASGWPAAQLEWEVHYALGSGTHGYAYLTDRDGYLFETPISWYSEKKVWDLSPGFRQMHLLGRAILPDCLFCHANRANHVEGSTNHYAEPIFDGYPIGCQRCHGPGALHVASRERAEAVAQEVDYTIVNPHHLENSLREAVCEQCHLQGKIRLQGRGRGLYDFRPGLPLELFWSVFVAAPGGKQDAKAVGHVEQMYESRCFLGGEGRERLGCISCHDPHEHVLPTKRAAYYRGRCLECHENATPKRTLADEGSAHRGAVRSCSLPPAERRRKGDSCIDCHMPRYASSDIPHAASTDHRILRGGKPAPASDARPARGDGLLLVSFYQGRKGEDAGETERDRALAVEKLALSGDVSASRVLGQALAVLEAALQRHPDDLAAAEARGFALALQNRWTEARSAFEGVLEKAPDQELALLGAATTAGELRQTDAAQGYWRRAIAVNPWEPGYRRHLALLLVKKEAWAEAQPECEAWVRVDPMSAEARAARVACLLAAGNKDEARAEFARIEALAPANLRELQIRFEKKLK